MTRATLPSPHSREFFNIMVTLTIVEQMRGEDTPEVYLHKLSRTIDDLLAGRTVLPWRAERLQEFFDNLWRYCMQQTGSSGCRVVRL